MLNRTALITGASSTIGTAIALRLSAQGGQLVLVGRDGHKLEAIAQRLPRCTLCVGDLADRDLPARLPAAEVLVHAATAHPAFRRVDDTTDGDLDEAADLSSGALLRLARHALPHMRAAGWGRIVAIGSLAATIGGPGQAAYAAAKAGLLGMVRSIASEVGRDGITCNLVELGLIDTERVRGAVSASVRERLAKRTALGRLGTADEVAAVVAFLVSDPATYVTGIRLEVSGGARLA